MTKQKFFFFVIVFVFLCFSFGEAEIGSKKFESSIGSGEFELHIVGTLRGEMEKKGNKWVPIEYKIEGSVRGRHGEKMKLTKLYYLTSDLGMLLVGATDGQLPVEPAIIPKNKFDTYKVIEIGGKTYLKADSSKGQEIRILVPWEGLDGKLILSVEDELKAVSSLHPLFEASEGMKAYIRGN
jgi:hypothetical protein